MKEISKLFLAGIIAILLFLFLIGKFDSCASNPPIPTTANEQVKKLVDSFTKEQLKKETKSKLDSLSLSKKIDSIKKKYSYADSSLKTERNKVKYFSSKLEEANSVLDTASYFHWCEELNAEVKILDNKIEDYKFQVDTLNRAKDSLQHITQEKANDYLNLLASFRSVARQLTNDNDSLINKNAKLTKKAEKKFAIGVGGTVGLTTTGIPGGCIGLTIQRIIFKL